MTEEADAQHTEACCLLMRDNDLEHTNFSRNVFSRSAPMHPAKPRMNITPPTTMKSQTGSRPPRSVIDERLDRTPCRGQTQHSV